MKHVLGAVFYNGCTLPALPARAAMQGGGTELKPGRMGRS